MRKSLLDFIPRCPVCNNRMKVDDIEYNFDGNQNEYLMCENNDCGVSCVVEFRYFKICHRPVKYYDCYGELDYNKINYEENKI